MSIRTTHPIVGAVLGVVLALAAALSLRSCRPSTPLTPAIAGQVQRNDSVQAAGDARVADAEARAAAAESIAVHEHAHAIASASSAAQLGHRADSLAVIAAGVTEGNRDVTVSNAVSDSNPVSVANGAAWHAAYDARTAQVDTLHAALQASDSARVAEHARADAIDSAFVVRTGELDSSRALTHTLTTALAHAEQPCRVLWLPCPSRVHVAIGAVALTVLADLAVRGKIAIPIHF